MINYQVLPNLGYLEVDLSEEELQPIKQEITKIQKKDKKVENKHYFFILFKIINFIFNKTNLIIPPIKIR